MGNIGDGIGEGKREGESQMAASVMSLLALKPAPVLERSQVKGLPSLARSSSSLRVRASAGKKIKTATPYGPGGGMNLPDGLDASGRKAKGKGVYQFADKYGANVDGYRNHGTINMGCYSCWTTIRRRSSCVQHQCPSLVELQQSYPLVSPLSFSRMSHKYNPLIIIYGH